MVKVGGVVVNILGIQGGRQTGDGQEKSVRGAGATAIVCANRQGFVTDGNGPMVVTDSVVGKKNRCNEKRKKILMRI